MNHQKPAKESSWIETIGFEDGVIEIHCKNGKVMRYQSGSPEVPVLTEADHEAFLEAESPGRFYNAKLKGIYQGGTVNPDAEEMR